MSLFWKCKPWCAHVNYERKTFSWIFKSCYRRCVKRCKLCCQECKVGFYLISFCQISILLIIWHSLVVEYDHSKVQKCWKTIVHNLDQVVTNIWIFVYIRIFSDMNIHSYHIRIIFLIQIYSDIHSYCFFDTNIFGNSFVSSFWYE